MCAPLAHAPHAPHTTPVSCVVRSACLLAGDAPLAVSGLAIAAAHGVLVDGVKLHDLLIELSKIVDEAIAQDDDRPNARSEYMVGEGVANSLAPKGHGADRRRKLVGQDVKSFLDALLRDDQARARLKRAIATKERPADHVRQCVQRKRMAHASYDAIDQYRDLFLIKHPSRGAMISEQKGLVGFIYANCMAAGPKWTDDPEELEQAREEGVELAQGGRRMVGARRAQPAQACS